MCQDQKGFIQEFERTEQQKTHASCTQCAKLLSVTKYTDQECGKANMM